MVHFTVSGRVQGVGFRYWVKDQAKALNLSGWVRNLSDGRVEVCAKGDEDSESKLWLLCKRGSPFSFVNSINFVERAIYSEPTIEENQFKIVASV